MFTLDVGIVVNPSKLETAAPPATAVAVTRFVPKVVTPSETDVLIAVAIASAFVISVETFERCTYFKY